MNNSLKDQLAAIRHLVMKSSPDAACKPKKAPTTKPPKKGQ